MPLLAFAEKPKGKDRPKSKNLTGWRYQNLIWKSQAKQWWEDPDVVVAFTFPRITARLERLMGTNVVRLTDRNYMKLLRERIDSNYREQLGKRIRARELRELERQRILIIEGKTDDIPDELQDDPIFEVIQEANVEILKTRSKLKTTREKHADRLKSQAMKWERERRRRAIEEAILLQKRRERQKRMKEIEEQYRREDAERGMDLLRIENDDWRECEMDLKEFLECERARMKERSNRIPHQYTRDPLDITNIMREKYKKLHGEPLTQRELDQKCLKPFETENPPDDLVQMLLEKTADYHLEQLEEGDREEDWEDDMERNRKKYDDDASDVSETSELAEVPSSLSEARRRHIELLEAELQEDINNGLLITKRQYDFLRYEDEKILALHDTKNMCDLYKLAEEIILGDRPPEEEEEEYVEEQQTMVEEPMPLAMEAVDPESQA